MPAKATKRILVVDDDDLLRDFYGRVLSHRGYEIESAANGDEALQVLENTTSAFSLVIIDLLMPVRTGWELIEEMKGNAKYAKIPLLAITGLATSFEEFERVKKACDDVMLKGDFELSRFTETVDRLAAK